MIISFINQKGGSGKTTSAINLSAYLASMGHRILLVDLDPQGNATSGLGGDPKSLQSIYQVLLGNESLDKVIRQSNIQNLEVVPGSNDLAGASVELVEAENREFRLKRALENFTTYAYDFIFIDCPPSLGILTINGLTASDKVAVPVQCEYFALEGLSQLLKTIDLVKKGLKPDLQILGAFLTMHDRRNSLSWDVIKEVQRNFPYFTFDSIIPRNVSLAEAPSYGKSILEYNPDSHGARAYQALAREFLHVAKSGK